MLPVDLGGVAAAAFPNGIVHYAVGGLLIGLGIVAIYLTVGTIVGASTFLESSLSYVSRLPRFRRQSYLDSREWRIVFTVGIIAGAGAYTLATGTGPWTTEVAPWRLLLGGVLVGIGTRIGKGCTSGHGVCGVASLSPTSLVNVVLFVGVAIAVAHLVEFAGVVP